MQNVKEDFKAGGVFKVKCFDKTGALKWEDAADNTVVNVGLQHLLDVSFTGSPAQSSAWYLGLVSGTPTIAAADTLAVHGGWTEVSAYAGDRPVWTKTRSGQTLGNTASKASFTINANGTVVGGCFLSNAATGTSGVLMSATTFTGGNKTADDGDTLEVTYELSASNA